MYLSKYLPEYLFKQIVNKPYSKESFEMESDDAYVINDEGNLVKLKDEFESNKKITTEIKFRDSSDIPVQKKPCSCMDKTK